MCKCNRQERIFQVFVKWIKYSDILKMQFSKFGDVAFFFSLFYFNIFLEADWIFLKKTYPAL